MKVFAGNEPTVPVSVVVDALDSLQAAGHGHGGKKKGGSNMQYAAAAPEFLQCMSTCSSSGVGDQGTCAALCAMPH